MPINIIDGFSINSAVPVDYRTVVATIADRNAITYKYDGLKVFVLADRKTYIWNTTGSVWQSEVGGANNTIALVSTSGITGSILSQSGTIISYMEDGTLTGGNTTGGIVGDGRALTIKGGDSGILGGGYGGNLTLKSGYGEDGDGNIYMGANYGNIHIGHDGSFVSGRVGFHTLTFDAGVYTQFGNSVAFNQVATFKAISEHKAGAYFYTTTTGLTSAAYIRNTVLYSTASNPDYTWYNDTDSGIYHIGANRIGLGVGAKSGISLRTSSNKPISVGIGNDNPSDRVTLTIGPESAGDNLSIGNQPTVLISEPAGTKPYILFSEKSTTYSRFATIGLTNDNMVGIGFGNQAPGMTHGGFVLRADGSGSTSMLNNTNINTGLPNFENENYDLISTRRNGTYSTVFGTRNHYDVFLSTTSVNTFDTSSYKFPGLYLQAGSHNAIFDTGPVFIGSNITQYNNDPAFPFGTDVYTYWSAKLNVNGTVRVSGGVDFSYSVDHTIKVHNHQTIGQSGKSLTLRAGNGMTDSIINSNGGSLTLLPGDRNSLMSSGSDGAINIGGTVGNPYLVIQRRRTNAGIDALTTPFSQSYAVINGSDSQFSLAISQADTTSTNSVLKLRFAYTSGSSNRFIEFRDAATEIGKIRSTGVGGVAYDTTSDGRLKEDYKSVDTLSTILKLNVVDFKWIKSGARNTGLIAQEVEKLIPEIVSPDVMNGDEMISPKGIDYSKLTPFLVRAIQEQQKTIEDLEKRLKNLEK